MDHAVHKLSACSTPKRYSDLANRKDRVTWERAYQKEIDAIESVGEFKVVPRRSIPAHESILPIKELFTIKADGRYKARIVVRGDLEPVENDQLYSPTASMEALRVLLAICAARELKYATLDVKNAYLYGKSSSPIYISLPDGHPDNDGSNIWMSNTAIYGLREAPKLWHATLHKVLLELKFKACPVDPCIYKRDDIILLLYVDDMLFIAPETHQLQELVKNLSKRFEVKVDWSPSRFLGFNIRQLADGILIDQCDKIEIMSKAFSMEKSRPTSVPMASTLDNIEQGELLKSKKVYQSLLGGLLYVNLGTRPEICYAINILSRMASKPTSTHLAYLRKVLQYLTHNKNYGIVFRKGKGSKEKIKITLEVDASYASGPHRKSTYGYVLFMNGSPVMFRTKH